jgi:parallel beta-helix repeat protein
MEGGTDRDIRWLGLALGAFAVLALAAILLWSPAAQATNDPPPSGGTVTGDWTVTDMRAYNGVSITLAGNLYVENGGTLVLDGADLEMYAFTPGQYEIEVRAGGKLVMLNSELYGGGSGFRVRPQGTLNISDSFVWSCGHSWGSYGETAGLFIESDACNLTGTTIGGSFYCVVVRGASPVFTGCYFETSTQGCVVIDSAASFTDCDFWWNQNGANFDNWSGNMTGCTFGRNTGFGLLAYGSGGNITGCDLVANGAGDCVLVGSDAAISNCSFRDSLYGIYIDEGAPRFSDCPVTGNRYGVYVYKSAPSFARCTISKNSLYGMSCLRSEPALEGCTISETGYSPRENIYYGRGIVLYDCSLSCVGGNLTHDYFGIEARYSTISVSGVHFTANAGGIFALESAANVTGCDFLQNAQLGVRLTEFCTGSFEGCTFTCETQAAVFDRQSSVQMRNSTFSGCRDGLKLLFCAPGAAVVGCAFENNSLAATLMGSDSTVLACSFANNLNFSLNASGSSPRILNCSFRDCPSDALTLDRCGGLVEGCVFDRIDVTALFCQNSTTEMANNTFRLGNGTAIHSLGENSAPDIHGNLFFKNGLGVALSDGSGGRVHDNELISNEQVGIALRNATGEVFQNTVSGSVHGISCTLFSDPAIHDNEVFGNEGGILCSDSSNATVRGNLVHNNSRFGIEALMSWPAIDQNDVRGNPDGILVDWCRGPGPVVLRGNRADNNTDGIVGQSSWVQIEDCNLTNNSMAGARLVNCLSTVKDSLFGQNRDGLRPEGGSVRIEDCDFLENNSTGIITEGTVAVIEECVFYRNTDGALDLGNSTIQFVDGVFDGNTATGFYCQWSSAASWTVGRTASASNDWFALRGNLTVLDGGSLRLANCTLSMMLSSPGEMSIEVRGGGRLEMTGGSRVEAAVPDNKYSFRLLAGGNLTIEEGTLQDCGGGWGVGGQDAGLVLLSPSCVLREVRFQNCTFGLVADGISGDFEYLTFSGCDYAVIAISSDLTLDNGTFRLSGSMDLQLRQGAVLTLVNTTFDRDKVSLLDLKCELSVYWYLGIGVAWQNNAVIEGAALTLTDASGARRPAGLTDERGWLMWVRVLELRQNYSVMDDRNPYAVSVSKANVTFNTELAFQKSVVLEITLHDLVPPFLQAVFPASGATLNVSLVGFSGSAADNETGLEGVEWSPDGSAWQPVNGSGQWSFWAQLAEGPHTMLVRATDVVGNRAVLAINFTVKTRINVLELVSPADGLLTRLSELTVNGTTESGASVQVNGQDVSVVSGYFSAVVRLAEGNNTILVTASDEEGNTATITRTVVLDTTAPDIELWSPQNGSYTNVRETTVSGRTEPGAKVLVNGQALVNSGGLFSLVVDMPSDSNLLNISVIDPAGNANSTATTVLVDLEPPALDILSPSDGHRSTARNITISGTTEPFSTVTAWDRTATAGADGSFSLNLTILYGNNTILIRSTDRAGNVNAVTWSVVRDRPAAAPGSPWAAALVAVAVMLAAENLAIILYRRRRDGPKAAAAPPASRAPEPPAEAAPVATAEPSVPVAVAEPVPPATSVRPSVEGLGRSFRSSAPPEALPVDDGDIIETVDMK